MTKVMRENSTISGQKIRAKIVKINGKTIAAKIKPARVKWSIKRIKRDGRLVSLSGCVIMTSTCPKVKLTALIGERCQRAQR